MFPAKLTLAALAFTLAAVPVLAQETTTCTEMEFERVKMESEKLTDADKKLQITQELMAARDNLNKKQMQGCFTHLNNAIQMLPPNG